MVCHKNSDQRLTSVGCWITLLLILCPLHADAAWRSLSCHPLPQLPIEMPGRDLSTLTRVVHLVLRGGDDSQSDLIDEESEPDDDYQDEDEDEANSMAQSAIKATIKSATQKEALSKATVKASVKATKHELQSSLDRTKTKVKHRRTTAIFNKIPYILRASLNPVILFAMTRAYFASLFNIHYLQQQPTQTLRSAMQEQSKKSGGVHPGKKSRKMRPGQAKTLSDLPQLSS